MAALTLLALALPESVQRRMHRLLAHSSLVALLWTARSSSMSREALAQANGR
ncbi:hypothetical protein U5801_07630 [Lamprobacter modestohalophilus]|uniref:hypothetical protein n=1 Tax=Lamprobacter modestohalophilus TaxID=1064514 RepID=UPI002ADED1CF|nr:hypothetical protein [Lamprobacter modestohalophilus]MEA1049677.1 hypothetical protein [Lamprobacter modestohalophilus]